MANSLASMNRNRLVYFAMDVQATGHQRIKEDRPEAIVLAEVAAIAQSIKGVAGARLRELASWLLDHDRRENTDHIEIVRRAKDICRIIEFPAQSKTAVNVTSINSGGDEAA